MTGIPNPKVWQGFVDCLETVRDVSLVGDETIPKGSKHAPGIEGNDRPVSLSIKRGDDMSDDL